MALALNLLTTFGSPFETTPASAFCSNGEMWYRVVPRIVAMVPNLPPLSIDVSLMMVPCLKQLILVILKE